MFPNQYNFSKINLLHFCEHCENQLALMMSAGLVVNSTMLKKCYIGAARLPLQPNLIFPICLGLLEHIKCPPPSMYLGVGLL